MIVIPMLGSRRERTLRSTNKDMLSRCMSTELLGMLGSLDLRQMCRLIETTLKAERSMLKAKTVPDV